MPRLLTDEGLFTEDARQHLLDLLNSKRVPQACCVAPAPQLVDGVLYEVMAIVGEEMDIRPGSRAIPKVATACMSCGTLSSYALKILIPDLDNWMQ